MDRGFVTATGRTLPRGTITAVVYADLLSVAASAGLTDWLTVNLGTPPWTVVEADAVLFGSLKARVLHTDPLDVSIGVFGVGDIRPDDESYGAVWPFAAFTVSEGRVEFSAAGGYGRGDEFFDIRLDREWAWQASAAVRIAPRLKMMGEWMRLGRDEVVLAGVRWWTGRLFLDLGVVSEAGLDQFWPWGSVGVRLR